MIKINSLDNINIVKNKTNFYDEALVMTSDNSFTELDTINIEDRTDSLKLLSDQKKIIIDHFIIKDSSINYKHLLENNKSGIFGGPVGGIGVHDTFSQQPSFNNYVYEFLHYIFFPMFFLNKYFDDVMFVFKKPKNLNKIDDEFLFFLFDILKYNDIKYLMIDDQTNIVKINNFLKYSRFDERFKNFMKIDKNKDVIAYDFLNTDDKTLLTPQIDNGHNYYLPKEIIFQEEINNENKIIIPISKNTKVFNLLEKVLYDAYKTSLSEISFFNVEIVYLEEFESFFDLLNFLKNVKYIIIVENSEIIPYLIFTPPGTTIFLSNNNEIGHFDNYLPKITHSMFFNNFVITNNLIMELECIN